MAGVTDSRFPRAMSCNTLVSIGVMSTQAEDLQCRQFKRPGEGTGALVCSLERFQRRHWSSSVLIGAFPTAALELQCGHWSVPMAALELQCAHWNVPKRALELQCGHSDSPMAALDVQYGHSDSQMAALDV
jgi:hypothetical protein